MRKLRTALICLLMLALPAQGVAALGMQLCAAIGQDEASSLAMAAPHGPAHDSQAAAPHGSHHAKAQSGKQTDSSLCSLCAFCVGAVALASVTTSQSPPQAVEPPLPRLERFVGFVGETPERPPRLFLV